MLTEIYVGAPLAEMPAGCNSPAMLTEIYIEALLVDEELADRVYAAMR